MLLNPPVPGERDWDAAPLNRQVRASVGLRHDHLVRVVRQAPTSAAHAELVALERYLARFERASVDGARIPWGHEPLWTRERTLAGAGARRPGDRRDGR